MDDWQSDLRLVTIKPTENFVRVKLGVNEWNVLTECVFVRAAVKLETFVLAIGNCGWRQRFSCCGHHVTSLT